MLTESLIVGGGFSLEFEGISGKASDSFGRGMEAEPEGKGEESSVRGLLVLGVEERTEFIETPLQWNENEMILEGK